MESTFTSLQAPKACQAMSPVLAAHAPLVAAGSVPLCPSSRPRLLWLVRFYAPHARAPFLIFLHIIICLCVSGATGLHALCRAQYSHNIFYVLLAGARE